VVSAHIAAEPEDPSARRSDLPSGLGAIVLTALAKEPEQRPRSARAYAQMLAVAARG